MPLAQSVKPISTVKTPYRYIFGYALGGCGYQILFNAMWAFASLYYTQVLGLDYILSAVAMSISVFWDAVSDPLMGHISDNTRSRYGRRHPYMLLGGIFMTLFFLLLWVIPEFCTGKWVLFAYLLVMNLLFRTALTVFMIPYGALGFEICTDYDERSLLQSTGSVLGMTANLIGIALGWRLFFPERNGLDGNRFADNYIRMGFAFMLASLVLVLFSVWVTRRYIRDSRQSSQCEGNNFRAFYRDFRGIMMDKNTTTIFLFFGMTQLGNALVACWQSYVWIYFMNLNAWEKTITHTTQMIVFVLGAFLSTRLSKVFDKKPGVFIGAALPIVASILLILIFYTGFLGPNVKYTLPKGIPLWSGSTLSVSLVVFTLLQSLYWMGAGIIGPLAASMIADTAEINFCKTGILKNGSYLAVLCFVAKLASTLGLLLQGIILSMIGFKEGGDQQSPEAILRLVLIMFLSGLIFTFFALLIARRYPIDRSFMVSIKAALRQRGLLDSQEGKPR